MKKIKTTTKAVKAASEYCMDVNIYNKAVINLYFTILCLLPSSCFRVLGVTFLVSLHSETYDVLFFLTALTPQDTIFSAMSSLELSTLNACSNCSDQLQLTGMQWKIPKVSSRRAAHTFFQSVAFSKPSINPTERQRKLPQVLSGGAAHTPS